jgi:hypothetical protein
MSTSFLTIGILVGIAGWVLYPLLIRKELGREVAWPQKRGQSTARYGHFTHRSAVEFSVPMVGDISTFSDKLAGTITSLPHTPTKLTIVDRALNQISFQNPRLVVWPGHRGSWSTRELCFSQGHFHFSEENKRILVTYELDFSELWRRTRTMAYLSLGLWGGLQISVPILLWFFLKNYPLHQTLFTLYLIAFSWAPYLPLFIFRRLRRRSCQVIEQIIKANGAAP